MFENITSVEGNKGKPAASLTVSLLLHGAVIGSALLAGYLGAHKKEDAPVPISVVLRAAPPPPPPPPPPPKASSVKKVKPVVKREVRQIIQPTEVPQVKPPEEAPAPASDSPDDDGVEGGVEGGVAGGVVGGVLGGIVSAAPPPPPPKRVEYNETMTRPTKLSGPDPAYTDQAIEREIQGTVVVKCVVTVEGIVKECRVTQSLPFMDRAVVDALLKRRYTPAIYQGQPIEVDYTFTIRLKLPE